MTIPDYFAKCDDVLARLAAIDGDLPSIINNETLSYWVRTDRTPEQIVAILCGTEYRVMQGDGDRQGDADGD